MDSSNFWKLDKIDKIGIALIFIVFALYSTFSCFAAEEIDFNGYIEHCTISPSGGLSSSSNNYNVYFLEIEPGFVYYVTPNFAGNSYYAFGNEISIGSETTTRGSVANGNTFSFSSSDFDYKYVYFFSLSDSGGNIKVDITREKLEGMQGSIDLLSGNVGFNVWESFTNTIVYALPITITCFGIYIICGFIKRFSKGV